MLNGGEPIKTNMFYKGVSQPHRLKLTKELNKWKIILCCWLRLLFFLFVLVGAEAARLCGASRGESPRLRRADIKRS